MKTYYDFATKYLISVQDKKIVSLEKKPVLRYDIGLTYNKEECLKYGGMGTAMLSGIVGKLYVQFKGTPLLADTSFGAEKMDILKGICVCSKEKPDPLFFQGTDTIMPFWTNEEDLMPLLGYVCFSEKIMPLQSFYEGQIKSKVPCSYHKIIESLNFLPGDGLGQMVQFMLRGNPVFNGLMTAPLNNPFYSKTISILPLKETQERPLAPSHVIVNPDFIKTLHLDQLTVNLSRSIPTEVRLTESQQKIFGCFETLNLYSGFTPYQMSSFWGLVEKFSQSRIKFIYVYDQEYRFVARPEGIFEKKD